MDLLFARRAIAVYVDGCFTPAPNSAPPPRAIFDWWQRKIGTNVAPDRDTDVQLDEAGSMVVRV